MNVEMPNKMTRYVDANGRLTLEGMKLFQRLIDGMQEVDERLKVLEP